MLDAAVLRRVFGVLGPTQAVVEMVAFVAVLMASGWRWGQVPDAGAVASASGAAFASVVLGQVGNAYACRSTSDTPVRLGWTSNRLLTWSVGVEVALLLVLVYVGPLAAILHHAPLPLNGWILAALAAPAVLFADALHKQVRWRMWPFVSSRQSRGAASPRFLPEQTD